MTSAGSAATISLQTLFESTSCNSIQVVKYHVPEDKAQCSFYWVCIHPVASSEGKDDAYISYKEDYDSDTLMSVADGKNIH